MTTGMNFMDQIKCLCYMALSLEFLLFTNVANTGNCEDWLAAGRRPVFLILLDPCFIHKVERAAF